MLPLLLQLPPAPVIPPELRPLSQELQRQGFKLRWETPPKAGAYGLFESGSRTVWVHPVTFELGIGRQTLIHEAVHAAQSCPQGKLTPLGVPAPLTPLIEHEISAILWGNYHVKDRRLEQEAFSLQGQPDGANQLVKLLKQRCKPLAPITPSSKPGAKKQAPRAQAKK